MTSLPHIQLSNEVSDFSIDDNTNPTLISNVNKFFSFLDLKPYYAC
jgi:hypothetical protein